MKQEKINKTKSRKEVSNMIKVARLFKVKNNEESSTLKAFVDVEVSGVVLIKGIRVLAKKEGGLFAAMPSQANDGKYYQTVKFLTPEANEELQKVVLAAYEA